MSLSAFLAQTTSSSPALLLPALAEVPYGGYLLWWKMLPFAVIFLIWIQLLLWMDKDTITARMPREMVNSIQWGLLILALIAAVMLPMFVVSLSVFVFLFALSVGGYLIWRNSIVGLSDIPGQMSLWFKNLFRSKKARRVEKQELAVAEGMLTLLDKRGEPPTIPAQEDPIRPAYEAAHRILLDPLYKGAERVVLASAGNRYATKFRVDGVEFPGMALESEVATATVDYIKKMAGLDLNERRKLQIGKMKGKTATAAHEIEVQTSGTRAGETLVLEIDRSKRYRQRATALGLSPQQRDVVAEVVAENKGLVLAAAPPGHGLTGLLYGLVQEHDAFVQHIITLERPIEREMEGVTQNELTTGIEPAEEAKQVSWIADQMPDVLMVMGIEGRDASREAIRLAGEENRRVYVGMRASDSADALTRWRTLVGDNKLALGRLEMIIAGRTVRKLCDACKEPYTPPEAALAKMGVPKGKVQQLYRARTEPMLDQRGNPIPCEFCGQLGYKGRLGVFEVVRIDAEARKALLEDPGPATVRNLLRAQKLPTLQEAALRAVVSGKTDLAEIQRAMGPASTATPSGGSKGGAPVRKPAPTTPAA